jgi:hypothetical protein
MHVGEYILALVIIVLGLALSDLAMSTHRLIRRRADVTFDATPVIAALLATYLILVNFWGDYHHYHGVTSASLWSTLPNLALLFLSFLIAAAALPDHWDGKLDLWQYYLSSRREFWTLVGVATLLAIVYDVATSWPEHPPVSAYVSGALVLGICGTLCVATRRWLHIVLLSAFFAMLVFANGDWTIVG